MAESEKTEKRQCPGEKYGISLAICRARQANNYPKCLLCKHREEDEGEGASGDPKIKRSIFRNSAVLGSVPGEINEYVMRKVGTAASQFLRTRTGGNPTMVIGCDRRTNSRNLARNFSEGVNAGGFNTYRIGVATPSAVLFALKNHKLGSAAFISGCNAASQMNGVRLYLKNGIPLGLEKGLDKIGLIARRIKLGPRRTPGKNKNIDVMKDYASYLSRLSPEIKPVKVALDASGGIAGEMTSFLCKGMPIDFIRSHCEPDRGKNFLGRTFPTNEVKRTLRDSVSNSSADLGIAVDFDGDICRFFDEEGNLIPNDVVGALIGRAISKEEPDSKIAYDLRSTAALREEVNAAGGEAQPCAGDRISLAEKLVKEEAVYAPDIYGRHLFKDLCCAESPTLAMLYMCSIAGDSDKPLSRIVEEVEKYTSIGVLQYNMPSKREAEDAIERLEQEYKRANKRRTFGLKIQFSDWWFHVRNPGGSSALQLIIEGKSESDCRRGRETIEKIINAYKR